MSNLPQRRALPVSLQWMKKTAQFIADTQLSDGSIPEYAGCFMDPWNHVEAAMGLDIGGMNHQAVAAYRWMAENQRADGSWWRTYMNGTPSVKDKNKGEKLCVETNFCAYIATGVWHHFLISKDRGFLDQMWPVVRDAINYVLRWQSPHGDIYWAIDEHGKPYQDSLMAGCSSIYKSLECAILIASELGEPGDKWREARWRLGHVLCQRPECCDRQEDRSRFSMDWFYPALTGVKRGNLGISQINARWSEFVEPGLGCRCVSDQPWITVAESCELVMALLVIGRRAQAEQIYRWQHKQRDSDGAYWTGYQKVEQIFWPEGEKPTWTSAAVLLAGDALYGLTPGRVVLGQRPTLD